MTDIVALMYLLYSVSNKYFELFGIIIYITQSHVTVYPKGLILALMFNLLLIRAATFKDKVAATNFRCEIVTYFFGVTLDFLIKRQQ